jgi:flotillin
MMDEQSAENVYLEQVLQKQDQVDRRLKRKAFVGGPVAPAPGAPTPAHEGDEGEAAGRAVNYRVTGFWLWRTVVVPPNVYVIHTRRGHEKPIHIGMGISFRYRPHSDAFLIVPAAVQTLFINANCICIERQGILVQAYVQWVIDDIAIAYRKLDFSNPSDPMEIVNIQLREQAEAAIKDKVATMSIDEVLSDKQPIIEELTHRLRVVAEGSREGSDAGLGLKIVTIQIKEAIVSSTRLWQNLQIPFRAEREKLARLAELESQRQIAATELEIRTTGETANLQAEGKLEQLRAETERAKYNLMQAEAVRRHTVEQEAERQSIAEQNATARVRSEAELELVLQKLALEQRRIASEGDKARAQMKLDAVQAQATHAQVVAELEVQELGNVANAAQTERELEYLKVRQGIDNDLSAQRVQAQLIARLPEIAKHMPAQELRTTIISSDGQEGTLYPLLNFVAGALSLAQDTFKQPDEAQDTAE